MLGCMIESELGHRRRPRSSRSLVDYVDLDGHLLIAGEPVHRASASQHGRLVLSDAPGPRRRARMSERLAIFTERAVRDLARARPRTA